jgi:hypothetical protein
MGRNSPDVSSSRGKGKEVMSKVETIKSGKVFFKIHGEDFTRLVRGLWADELQTVKAIRLLVLGLNRCTEPIAISILTGEKKLVGVNTLDLVDDGATQTENGNLLSAVSVMARIENAKEWENFRRRVNEQLVAGQVKVMGSPWGLMEVPISVWKKMESGEWNWNDAKSLCRSYGTYYPDKDEPGHQATREALVEKRKNATNPTKEINGNIYWREEDEENIVDRFLDNDRKMRKVSEEGAKPDKELVSENGWIAPNGDFFPCGEIQHDWLADVLHGEKDGVKVIEKTHVRISVNHLSRGMRSPFQFEGKQLTQKQKDTIWDWCQKHDEKCPDWAFKEE